MRLSVALTGRDRTGIVFDIQRYSVDDGPGIRTTVFMKGCPLRCRWCQNPEGLRREIEVGFRATWCKDLRACSAACPNGAIALGAGDRIVRARCQHCGACAEACPTGALALIGRRVTSSELVAEVTRDVVFFRVSGGGVTMSGGEPLLQYAFVAAFLRRCREVGLGTAVETSGHVPWRAFAEVLPHLDRLYFDLKLAEPREHVRYTGVSNHRILSNARSLVAAAAPVIFRVPLVPTITLTPQNLAGLASFLHELRVGDVELCPYHDGWRDKLAWLGESTNAPAIPVATEEALTAAARAFSRRGIAVRLAGAEARDGSHE